MMKDWFVAIKVILIFISSAFCSDFFYPGFHDNPNLHGRLRAAIEPHILPLDHPLKPILDVVFSQSRVTETIESIKNAGFTILHAMPRSFVVIARHRLAPGYISKCISIRKRKDGTGRTLSTG